MRLSNTAPALSLRRTAALLVLFLTALAVSLWGGSSVNAADGPTVTGVAITSGAGSDKTYALGQNIRVTLTFSEAVNVSGTPQVAIDMDPAEWGTKWAAYQSGSGSSSIVFAHTVIEPNYSTRGIAVLANSLRLNGGSITSVSSGTAAALSHAGLDHDPNHKVDWQASAPTVLALAVTSLPGEDYTYAKDDVIEVSVALSEAVTVTGTPQIAIDMDPAHWGTKWASYARGSGSNVLTFSHTVVEPNYSTQGVAVLSNSLRLNGGSITSTASGAAAILAHAGLAHDPNHKVDWELSTSTETVVWCQRTAPSSVTALTIGKGAVVSWTLPDNLDDSCEVTGFVVTALSESSPIGYSASISDTQARTHTFRDLTPGDYRFSVGIQYPSGDSDGLVTMEANEVPDACISLAIKPYARNAVSGRITSINGTGCEARATFDLELKRSSDDYWRGYSALPWRYVDTQSDASLPHFIFYGIDPNVAYDFRISAYDASGDKYATTGQSVTITSQDPSATADANSPAGVRLFANNHGNLVVLWDAFTAPAGRTLTNMVVEWKSCADPNSATGCTGAASSATVDASDTRHRITGLTDGLYYTVRVAAHTHANGQPPSTATNAWSVWAPAVRTWFEPTQVWLTAAQHASGRFFVQSKNNKNFGGATVCSGSSAEGDISINCPDGTLVHVEATGSINVAARYELDGVRVSSTRSSGREGGPGAPAVFASGGDGTLVVEWDEAGTNGAVGSIDQYIVRHRSGTSGSWTNTVKGVNDRSHTFTGLANGTWQVHVRARTDGNDNDPNTQDTTRLGFQSEILTITLASGNTATVELPRVRVIPGDSQSLIVEWDLVTSGSLPYAYQVRHRASGATSWTRSDHLFPRATQRICLSIVCDNSNPRNYTITGLTGGTRYEVEVRARNANGWGEWTFTKSGRPND